MIIMVGSMEQAGSYGTGAVAEGSHLEIASMRQRELTENGVGI